MGEEYKIQKKNFTIKELQEEDRPREKLMKYGKSALTDSELLAILIGSGTVGFSAIDAAQEMIGRYGGLNKLARRSLGEIKQTKGIGDAKAITLMAAFEMGKRIESKPIDKKEKITSPEIIYKIFGPKMRDYDVEIFKVLLLDNANQIIKDIDVAKGTINQVTVHPREIFRSAITESAASIIAIHNHPSGNLTPSIQDRNLTKRILDTGVIIGIPLIDHIIIAGDEFYSFKGNSDVI